ncbi:aprataxin and PNK-like factor isoform X2 [Plodia interpunctella]|uniref:aprataxin and PNK-like factor isoform X2 n=1 Tax=Plodia interpunctella TaxID=58824 RepID=UPI002367B92D|nr:aprataxin and PNK-like factor isoform X2 [Plodia interpunctella]
MGFKLQRVDVNGVNDTCQIQLEEGKHLIGRGKFLHCEDKRVSRSHGELEVTENSVNLKALHTNPCFYTRKDTLTREMLKQNDSIDLRNGDRFGLLPVNCWYKVLYTTDDVEDQTSVKKETQLENGQSETNRTVFFDSTQVDNGFTDRMDTAPQPTNDNVSNPPPPNDNEQPPSPNDSNVSQSLMQDLPEALQCINDLTENEKSPRNPTDTDLPVRIKTEQVDLDPVPLSPLKRPFPSTSEVKLEPEQNVKKIKAENDDDKFSDDVKAGSSNSSNGPDANPAPRAGPAGNLPPAQPRLRERCMYGANCYRRNPVHKQEFSHPADADWGAGARGACPWGAACVRRSPAHWALNIHPPGTLPPAQRVQQGNKQRRKKKRPSTDSEASGQDMADSPDIILTGKRARKKVDVQKWSDSESNDEDPFQTDDEDEWRPSGSLDTDFDSQINSQDD